MLTRQIQTIRKHSKVVNFSKFEKFKKSRGASAVEYIIGLVAIVGILITPIPPSNKNVIVLLEEAIKKEHSAYVFGSAVPRMPDKN